PERARQIASRIVEDRIRDLDQVVEHGLARRVAKVERERFGAPVEGLEEERILLGQVRRHVACAVAPHARILDLDDLGAQIRQHLRAEGPRPELGDGQDAHALERWLRHVSREVSLPPRWRGFCWARGPCAYWCSPGLRAGWSRR